MINHQNWPSKGIYNHYKGEFYEVLGQVTSDGKGKPWVFYQLCYGANELALRGLKEFTAERMVKGEKRAAYAFVPNKAHIYHL